MTLERAFGGIIDIAVIEDPIEAALLALSRGLAESDGFNRLVLEAGLNWRDVAMMRALGRYLPQIGITYGLNYLAVTLPGTPPSPNGLSPCSTPLRPARGERARRGRSRLARRNRGGSQSGHEPRRDRILRRFVNLVQAAVRTTFFQTDRNDLPRPTITFKFDARRIDDLPLPKPLYEIYIYSPQVEGVHLRFGTVARGGLRWSDRPQDSAPKCSGWSGDRSKNAVIVPVGAKGGFFPKQLPPASDRQAARRGDGELQDLRPHPPPAHRQPGRRPRRPA